MGFCYYCIDAHDWILETGDYLVWQLVGLHALLPTFLTTTKGSIPMSHRNDLPRETSWLLNEEGCSLPRFLGSTWYLAGCLEANWWKQLMASGRQQHRLSHVSRRNSPARVAARLPKSTNLVKCKHHTYLNIWGDTIIQVQNWKRETPIFVLHSSPFYQTTRCWNCILHNVGTLGKRPVVQSIAPRYATASCRHFQSSSSHSSQWQYKVVRIFAGRPL